MWPSQPVDPQRRGLLRWSFVAVTAAGTASYAGATDISVAERAAGVQPQTTDYPPGDVRRYGAVADGDADDTVAIRSAIRVAAAGRHGVLLTPGAVHMTAPVVISRGTGIPAFVQGNASTLKARPGSKGPLLTVENPHAKETRFELSGITLDAASICDRGLLVHGSQQATIRQVLAVGSTGPGIEILGEPGFGVYYNLFECVQAGASGRGNGGPGWLIHSAAGEYRNASNVFIGARTQFNIGDGLLLNWANNTFVGIESERNDGYAVSVDNSYCNDFFGGYCEHNRQGFATGNAKRESPDQSFSITMNSAGVKVIGGRMIGNPAGGDAWPRAGNVYMPGTSANGVIIAPGGGVAAGSLSLRGEHAGLGLDGASPVRNAISFSPQDPGLQVSGVSVIGLSAAIGPGQTGMLLRCQDAGGTRLLRVLVGPADSAGPGFRQLRVPN